MQTSDTPRSSTIEDCIGLKPYRLLPVHPVSDFEAVIVDRCYDANREVRDIPGTVPPQCIPNRSRERTGPTIDRNDGFLT